MRRPQEVGLALLLLVSLSGCASVQERPNALFPSTSGTSQDAVNIWPEPRSAWLPLQFPSMSRLWNRDASVRTAQSGQPRIRKDGDWVASRSQSSPRSARARSDDDVQPADGAAEDDALPAVDARDAGRSRDDDGPLLPASLVVTVRAQYGADAPRTDEPSPSTPGPDGGDQPPPNELQAAPVAAPQPSDGPLLPPGSLSDVDRQARTQNKEPKPETDRRPAAPKVGEAKTSDEVLPKPAGKPAEPVSSTDSMVLGATSSSGSAAGSPSAPGAGKGLMELEATDEDDVAAEPSPRGAEPPSPTASRAAPYPKAPPYLPPSPPPPAAEETPPAPPVSTREQPATPPAGAESPPPSAAQPESALAPAMPATASQAQATSPPVNSPPATPPEPPKAPAPADDIPAAASQPSPAAAPAPAPAPAPSATATAASSTRPVASAQGLYASPPPIAPPQPRGRLLGWLFHDSKPEPLASPQLPPATFPTTYPKSAFATVQTQPEPQKKTTPCASPPKTAKKPCPVLTWIHQLADHGRGPVCCCCRAGGCGSGCGGCVCRAGKSAAAASAQSATVSPPASARSRGPEAGDVAEERKVVDGSASQSLNETPQR